MGCASNEGAYLSEWVFYHLALGVKQIRVYVNNTTDNSLAILKKIGEYHPVSFVEADELIETDWKSLNTRTNPNFITRSPAQAKCLVHAYEHCESDQFDYFLSLDIDEFLYAPDGLDNAFKGADRRVLNFRWFNLSGDQEMFAPLANCRAGQWDDYTKFAAPTGVQNLQIQDPHTCNIATDIGLTSQNAYVLHRNLRSLKEYFSILRKTVNVENTIALGIKQNRRGWRQQGPILFRPTEGYFCQYSSELQKFVTQTHVETEILNARASVIARADETVRLIEDMRIANASLSKVLIGTGVRHFDFWATVLDLVKWKVLLAVFPSLTHSHSELKKALRKQ